MECAELNERANQARNLAMGLLATAVLDLVPPTVRKPDWIPMDGYDRRRWQSEWKEYQEEWLYHEQAKIFLFDGDPIVTRSGKRITCDDLLAEVGLNPVLFRRMAREDPGRIGKAMFDAVHYGAELRVPGEDNDPREDGTPPRQPRRVARSGAHSHRGP